MPHRVDLAAYNKDRVRVFAGRKYGERVRQAARLEALEATGEPIEVLFPADTISVNSSFFLGMFGESIRQLGEDDFRRQYTFKGLGAGLVLEDAIREARTPVSALGFATRNG